MAKRLTKKTVAEERPARSARTRLEGWTQGIHASRRIASMLLSMRPEEAGGGGAHTCFAISRSLNFWIFPVLVFGSSANTT